MCVLIQIESEKLQIEQYRDYIELLNQDSGAEVSFTGYVRKNDYAEPITHLHIEHYPNVTEQEIKKIVEQAQQRWQLTAVVVAHRVGEIAVGEPIVWVMTQSKHRRDAYAANEFIMDFLKSKAPFWKKEQTNQGERWIEARESDKEALSKW